MPDLYPLLLLPEFVERVWGSRNLAPIYEHKRGPNHEPIGEAWLTGDDCRVANGPLAGKTLVQLATQHGRDLLGEAAPQADRFPLLVKFLFPQEKLSVQVHPDDDGARRLGQACGKTECWYVLAAQPGAQIGLGLKPGTTREQFRVAIEQRRAEELLNWIEIHPGELIYVDAGTVHAIGPGSVLVETQQNSDTTYRLYDYGRPRELHMEQGLTAIKEKTFAGKVPQDRHDRNDESNVNLVTSPCFVVNRRKLPKGKEHIITRHMPPSSVQIIVALEGCGSIVAKGAEPVVVSRGQAVVIPAALKDFRVQPQWQLEYLHISLPQDEVGHPTATLA